MFNLKHKILVLFVFLVSMAPTFGAESKCTSSLKSHVVDRLASFVQSPRVLALNKKLAAVLTGDSAALPSKLRGRFVRDSLIKGSIRDTWVGATYRFKEVPLSSSLFLEVIPPKKIMGRSYEFVWVEDYDWSIDKQYRFSDFQAPTETIIKKFVRFADNFHRIAFLEQFVDLANKTPGYPPLSLNSFVFKGDKIRYAKFSALYGNYAVILPTKDGLHFYLIKKRKSEVLLADRGLFSFMDLEELGKKGEFRNKAWLDMVISNSGSEESERVDQLGLITYDFNDMWARSQYVGKSSWPEWIKDFLEQDTDINSYDPSTGPSMPY